MLDEMRVSAQRRLADLPAGEPGVGDPRVGQVQGTDAVGRQGDQLTKMRVVTPSVQPQFTLVQVPVRKLE